MSKDLERDFFRYYGKGEKSPYRSTLKNRYIKWRKQSNMQARCDEEDCYFYKNKLVWKGKELRLILDHINGVNTDNRLKNLRYLCPNCNSQEKTHGGGNKGRTGKDVGGFWEKKDSSNLKDYTMPIEAADFEHTGSDIEFTYRDEHGKKK